MSTFVKASWLAAALLGISGCQIVSGLDELEVKTSHEESTEDSTEGEDTAQVASSEADAAPAPCSIPKNLDCSPANNCGCDDDEVCGLEVAEGDLTVACQPPGDKQVGDACNLGECAAGALCVSHVCLQVCRFNNDCEASGATCTQVQRPNGEALTGVRYCMSTCDLVSPSDPSAGVGACSDEQTCAVTAQGSVCTTDVGPGVQGDACDEPSDCAAGFTCDTLQCKQWCTVEKPSCDAGFICEPVANPGPATKGYGVCSGGCEASIPEGDECLTNPDCGCFNGETCRVMGDGTRACSPAGNVEEQAGCSDDSDCGDGLACTAGLCRPYCDLDAAACTDSSLCVEVQYDGESVGVGACLGLCDPVRPDTDDEVFTPCGEGAECIAGDLEYSYPTSNCMPAAAEPGPMLGVCDENNPCAAGAACFIGRCFPFCRDAADCEGATESAHCFDSDLGFRGAEDDVLGLCCPPSPVEGSSCAFDLDCGCGAGSSCRIGDTSTGATACTPVGEAGYQEECVYDSDCINGHSCVGGLCSPHCIGNAPCEVNEGECIQVYSDADPPQPVPYAFVCAGRCDPVDLTRSDTEVKPCGAGADCVAGWADETEALFMASFCAPNLGDALAAEPCESDTECALGLACDFVNCPPGDDCLGACTQYCDDDDDCEPGFGCDLTVGRVGTPGSNVGYCRL